mmetsp:Transcript_20199/g.48102  ORF Transcript_20199/g.48102 Transcript_20199/m.48102 type:complete len:230 (-) Transcript_20199:821-1510(-)
MPVAPTRSWLLGLLQTMWLSATHTHFLVSASIVEEKRPSSVSTRASRAPSELITCWFSSEYCARCARQAAASLFVFASWAPLMNLTRRGIAPDLRRASLFSFFWQHRLRTSSASCPWRSSTTPVVPSDRTPSGLAALETWGGRSLERRSRGLQTTSAGCRRTGECCLGVAAPFSGCGPAAECACVACSEPTKPSRLGSDGGRADASATPALRPPISWSTACLVRRDGGL